MLAGLRPLVAAGLVWPIAAVGLRHLGPVVLDRVPLLVANRSPSHGSQLGGSAVGRSRSVAATKGAAAAWSH